MLQPSRIERTPLGRAIPGGVTERQVEILRLRALGYSGWEVGVKLELSEQTIKNHTQTMYKALDVTNFADALRAMGWLKVP